MERNRTTEVYIGCRPSGPLDQGSADEGGEYHLAPRVIISKCPPSNRRVVSSDCPPKQIAAYCEAGEAYMTFCANRIAGRSLASRIDDQAGQSMSMCAMSSGHATSPQQGQVVMKSGGR